MKKSILLALLLCTLFLAWGSIAGAGNTSDETVRISPTDTTSGNLQDKLAEGSGINIDNLVTGANEKLTISTEDKLATKGDLLTHDGSGDSTLAVGTDGQVLVVDSTAPDGIKWDSAVDLSSPGPIGDGTPNTGEFTTLEADEFEWKGLRKILFGIQIRNNSGTLQHSLMSLRKSIDGTNGAPNFVSGISGLSGTAANTPRISSTVGFVNGVGILEAGDSNLTFDYDVGQGNNAFLLPIVIQDTTGNNLSIVTNSLTLSVNGGPSINRGFLALKNGNDNNRSWNTTNIPNGKLIRIIVMGYIKV
jgi:hypothetical protein